MFFLFDECPAQGEAVPSGSGLFEATLALWVALRGPQALWRNVLALLSEEAVFQYLGGSSVLAFPSGPLSLWLWGDLRRKVPEFLADSGVRESAEVRQHQQHKHAERMLK